MIESALKEFSSRITSPITALIACSGGLDSSVLLHALVQVQSPKLSVGGIMHVNHNLRADSKKDEEFVRNLATKFELPFFCMDVCPVFPGLNNEAWGREIRYQFFKECLVKNQASHIFTAHHLDDQVETFIFKLITSRTNLNLSLIKEMDLDRQLVRPFLKINKKELLDYALRNGITFLNDSTNSDTKYARNFIRHEILPQFAKINPDYLNGISGFIERVNHDLLLLEEISANRIHDDLFALLNENDSIALRSLLRKAKDFLNESAEKLSIRRYRDLLDFLRTAPKGECHFDMGNSVVAIVDFRYLGRQIEFVSRDQLNERRRNFLRHKEISFELEVGQPVFVRCPLTNKRIKFLLQEANDNSEKADESFKLNLNDSKLYVSGEKKSDFIYLEGIGKKRISRIFKEKNLSLRERRSLFYISQGELPIWIPNVVKSEVAQSDSPPRFSISTIRD